MAHVKVPDSLFAFWNTRADLINMQLSEMSERQRKKIEEAILRDPKRFAESEIIRALDRDVAISGPAALHKRAG